MSNYDPDQDPDVRGEAVSWGWKLHISQQAIPALLETEEIIDKIVDKALKLPALEELKPVAPAIKWTLKHHRKREKNIAQKWGTGVCLVSPWIMPTLLRPMKQHEDDTHMAWTAFDPDGHSWGETQLMNEAFRSETGPAVIGFEDKLFSVYRGAGSDSRLYYTTFQKNDDGSDDWTDPQPLGEHYTADEPALAVLDGELFCFYNGAGDDTQVYYATWTGSGWSSCQSVPGLFGKAGPGAAVYPGKIFVAVAGSWRSGQEGRLWWSVYANGRWGQPTCSPGNKLNLPPALVMHGGAIRIIYTGTDESFFIATFTSDTTLSSPMKFPHHLSSDGPSVVSHDGVLYVVSRASSGDQIWFTYSTDDGRTWTNHARVTTPDYVYTGKRPGLTTWRHSTGTRDQLLMLYRGPKV